MPEPQQEQHRPGAGAAPPPGVGNLTIGYLLLGLQPIPISLLASQGWNAADTVFARFSFSAFCLVLICSLRRRGLRTGNLPVLLLRGVLGAASVLLYFTAIQYAGAARGTLLNYTYPIWANLFAHLLGSKASRGFWLALAVAFAGTALIVMPPGGFSAAPIGKGEIAGLLSAMLAGGAVLSIKKLRDTDESLSIIATFTFFSLLMSAPLADLPSIALRINDFSVLMTALAVGVLAFSGHVFFTRGYLGASVQQATLLSLVVPATAAITGILFLGENFSAQFVWGGLLVTGSLGLLMTSRAIEARRAPRH